MFLGVHVYAAEEIAIIDPMNAVIIAHAVAICGAQIVDASAWVYSRSGVNFIQQHIIKHQ